MMNMTAQSQAPNARTKVSSSTPLGSALSVTLMLIVMVALLFYVRNAGTGDKSHG